MVKLLPNYLLLCYNYLFYRELVLQNVTPKNQGKYTCVTSNAAGMVEFDFDVEVLGAPTFVYKTNTERTGNELSK